MRHPAPEVLALYARGDLEMVARLRVGLHIRGCEECGVEVRAVRAGLSELKEGALELPAGLDWDALAAEMRANVRLGLAAGAIVREPRAAGVPAAGWAWQLGVVMGSVVVLGVMSWMLPGPDAGKAGKTGRAGVFLAAQAEGLELRDHGSALTLLNPRETAVTTTVNWDGGARASYVDSETGQVTIHHVSAE